MDFSNAVPNLPLAQFGSEIRLAQQAENRLVTSNPEDSVLI
jgi:hypothetical protein